MNNRLLISSLFLVFFLQGKGQSALFEEYGISNGMASSKILDVDQDLLGSLWFVHPRSVSVQRGFEFQVHNLNLPISDSLVGIIIRDNRDPLVYSKNGTIQRFGSSGFKEMKVSRKLRQTLGSNSITEIRAGRGGKLWASLTNGGLLQISKDQIVDFRFPYEKELRFYGLEIDDNRFISGELDTLTNQNRLIVFAERKIFDVPLSLSKKGKRSGLMRSSESGFYFFRGVELISFSERGILQREFTEKNIQCFLVDREGKLWIGMKDGGLLCYPLGMEDQSTSIRYLGDEDVSCLYEDESGTLWIGTTKKGAYSFEQRLTEDYRSPNVFSNADSAQTTSKAIRLAYDPIGSITGQSTNLERDTSPPDVFVTGLRIKGKDTAVHSEYILNYDMNFFEFSFIGFSEFQELFQYRYRMEGVDEDWVLTSRNLAQYTALAPGNYRFEVQAINKSGLWSESSEQIKLRIRPPLWERLWFRALLISFVLLLIALGVVVWLRAQRRREKRRVELNRKISEMELRALRSQMNPHFLFNTLSSIQHFITVNKSKEAIQYLSKFARLMRTILENSKKSEIPLRSELEALDLYLLLESFRFKEKFDYEIVIEDELDQDYDHIPPLLIQPYVENAIVHGMMHKRERGHILIHLKREEDMLLCVVEDDGVGREKALEFKKGKHESSGLSITKERLEIINSTRKSNLSVKIIDLKDDAGNSLGTRVEIYIPLED